MFANVFKSRCLVDSPSRKTSTHHLQTDQSGSGGGGVLSLNGTRSKQPSTYLTTTISGTSTLPNNQPPTQQHTQRTNQSDKEQQSAIGCPSSLTSPRCRSVRELSNLEYLRVKQSQSRDKGQYYDLSDGVVYRNYKYEKLNLQHRQELAFISKKPLDFVGKSFAAQGTTKHGTSKAELAQSAIKRSKEVYSLGGDTPRDPTAAPSIDGTVASSTRLMRSIQQKLQNDAISSQFKEYPFESKAITKNLKQLNTSIKHRLIASSKSLTANPKWVSPLTQHESMKTNGQNGSDLILKNELLISGAVTHRSQADASSTNHLHRSLATTSRSRRDSTYISVVHFNKAFQGKQHKMRSLLSTAEREPRPTCTTGEMMVKHVQKKSQYLRVVEEFNRILEKDKVNKAIANTKKIKTKVNTEVAQLKQENQNTTISREIFLKETPYFMDAVRQDGSVAERIFSAISNEFGGGITFEGYLQFYQIFLLQNTPQQALIDFLAKYFCSSNKPTPGVTAGARRRTTVRLNDFIVTLEELMIGGDSKHQHQGSWRQAIEVVRVENGEQDEEDDQVIVTEDSIRNLLERNVLNRDILHKQLFV